MDQPGYTIRTFSVTASDDFLGFQKEIIARGEAKLEGSCYYRLIGYTAEWTQSRDLAPEFQEKIQKDNSVRAYDKSIYLYDLGEPSFDDIWAINYVLMFKVSQECLPVQAFSIEEGPLGTPGLPAFLKISIGEKAKHLYWYREK